MSKTSKMKRLMMLCMSVLLVIAGAVSVAPTASADEFTTTVFSASGWDYANVRSGPTLNDQAISTVPAGSEVTLGCWVIGGKADGPYGTSFLWYRISGKEGYISDTMVYTGTDEPVTSPCDDPASQSIDTVVGSSNAAVFSAPGWDYANVRSGPGTENDVIRTIPAASSVTLGCWVMSASSTGGPYGSSSIWYAIDDGYISDAMVNTGSDIPITSPCALTDAASTWTNNGSNSPTPTDNNQKPRCDLIKDPPTDATVAGGNPLTPLSTELYLRYVSTIGTDRDVIVHWGRFASSPNFIREVKQHKEECFHVDGKKIGKDIYLSLGTFTVKRVSKSCYKVYDRYDFEWDRPVSRAIAEFGWAREFNVRASGCLHEG